MSHSIYLFLAIIFEVCGSSMLKSSEGFTVLWPTIGVFVGYILAFSFFGLALKTMNLSSAYAIWSGVGTAITAGVGVFFFQEHMGPLKIIGLALIILGVVLLNNSQKEAPSTE